MDTSEFNAGANLTMEKHLNQGGGVEILAITSCYKNRDKLRPAGPLDSYADFVAWTKYYLGLRIHSMKSHTYFWLILSLGFLRQYTSFKIWLDYQRIRTNFSESQLFDRMKSEMIHNLINQI